MRPCRSAIIRRHKALLCLFMSLAQLEIFTGLILIPVPKHTHMCAQTHATAFTQILPLSTEPLNNQSGEDIDVLLAEQINTVLKTEFSFRADLRSLTNISRDCFPSVAFITSRSQISKHSRIKWNICKAYTALLPINMLSVTW